MDEIAKDVLSKSSSELLHAIRSATRNTTEKIKSKHKEKVTISRLSPEELEYIKEFFWDEQQKCYKTSAVEIGNGLSPISPLLLSLIDKKILIPISMRTPSPFEIPLIMGITIYKNSIITCRLSDTFIKQKGENNVK